MIKKKADAPLEMQQLSGRSRFVALHNDFGLLKNRNSSVRSLSPSSFKNLMFKNQTDTAVTLNTFGKKESTIDSSYIDLRPKQSHQPENRSSIKLTKQNSQYQFYISGAAGQKPNNSSAMSTSDTKNAKNGQNKPTQMSLNLNSESMLASAIKHNKRKPEDALALKSNRTAPKSDVSYYKSYVKRREIREPVKTSLFN